MGDGAVKHPTVVADNVGDFYARLPVRSPFTWHDDTDQSAAVIESQVAAIGPEPLPLGAVALEETAWILKRCCIRYMEGDSTAICLNDLDAVFAGVKAGVVRAGPSATKRTLARVE